MLADQASQELETIVRTNMRREQDLSAQCVRYQIEHQEKVDEMVGSARVQEIGAKSRMDVLIGQAKGDLEVATAEGEKDAEVIRKNMQIECERRKVSLGPRPLSPALLIHSCPVLSFTAARPSHSQLPGPLIHSCPALSFTADPPRLPLGPLVHR